MSREKWQRCVFVKCGSEVSQGNHNTSRQRQEAQEASNIPHSCLFLRVFALFSFAPPKKRESWFFWESRVVLSPWCKVKPWQIWKKKRILDIHGDNARQVGNDKENIWKCFHLNWLGISFMPENLKQRHRPKMTAIGGNSKGMICFRLGWSCRHSCWNCLCNVSIVLIVWCNRRK